MAVEGRKSKLKDPKVLRVFFSSPFNGMEGEREELTKRYWPQLHHLCNSKGLQFVAVDMRWGITTESSDSAQVISICLRELDRSDMFVGFFGQRYGWHGSQDKALQQNFDNAVSHYPWLDNYRDRSVTELEFLHGHLNNVGELPACICFRDKAWDDVFRQEGIERGDKKAIYKYSSESETATMRMNDLKRRVKETEEKCLGVEMAYKTPELGAKFMFDCVWKHLTEVLLKDESMRKLTWREEQLSFHDVFAATRCGVYLGGEEYMKQLDEHVTKGPGKLLYITGPPGSGKSALLANWIQMRRGCQGDVTHVYHYTGSGSGSTAVENILMRLTHELRHALGKEDNSNQSFGNEQQSTRDLLREFQSAMKEIHQARKTAVIVIDGFNKIEQKTKVAKHLFWLPSPIPDGIHFILSSVIADNESKAELVDNRGCQVVELQPLARELREKVCVATLAEPGKEFSPHQLEKVISTEQTENPLYLKIVLQELIMFGNFHKLNAKIESLIVCKSAVGLFKTFLERLESDYDVKEYDGNLVCNVTCALALCKEGLSEDDLMSIFNIPPHIWSPVFFAMDKYLLQNSGLLSFAYSELQTAVEEKYMPDEQDRQKHAKVITKYFWEKLKNLREKSLPVPKHICEELPWMCAQTVYTSQLIQVLADVEIFNYLSQYRQFLYLEYWRKTDLTGKGIADAYLKSCEDEIAKLYSNALHEYDDPNPALVVIPALTNMGLFLSHGFYNEGAEMMWKRAQRYLEDIDVVRYPNKEEEMTILLYRLACLYVDDSNNKEGEKYHLAALEHKKRLFEKKVIDEAEMNRSYHGLGVMYQNMLQYDKALEYYNQAKDQDPYPHAQTLNNIATIHAAQGHPYKALPEYLESLKIYEDHFFDELNPELGNILSNIGICYRRLDNYTEAEKYYQKALQLKKKAYGLNHPHIATAFANLGTLAMYRSQFEEAEKYYRQALEIQVKTAQNHLDTIKTKENIVSVMFQTKGFSECEDLYWEVFDWYVERGELHQSMPGLHQSVIAEYGGKQDYDKLRKIIPAIIQAGFARPDDLVTLRQLDDLLPPDERPKRPEDWSLKSYNKKFPENLAILRYHLQLDLVPVGDIDGIKSVLKSYLVSLGDTEEPKLGPVLEHILLPMCRDLGREELIPEILKFSESIDPRDPYIMNELLQLYSKAQDYPALLLILLKMSELEPDNKGVIINTAKIAAMTGEYQTARKYIKIISDKWGDEEQIAQGVQELTEAINEGEAG